MKKAITMLLSLVLLLGVLTGCGAQSKMATAETAAAQYDTGNESYAMGSDTNEDSGLSLPEGHKWIITVETSVETEDMDTLLAELNAEVSSCGGYLERQQLENGSTRAARRYRYANLTVRVPAEKLDAFLGELQTLSNVVSSSRSAEDATLTYVDTQTRIKSLETERDRLLELMEQAEDMSDLLTVEERLTQVRYELELYESRMRELDNQIDYATIYVNVTEVTEYTPVAEKTFWQRVSSGFAENLQALWIGIQDALVWLLSALPILLPLALVIWLIVVLCRRSAKKKREKRIAAWQAQQVARQNPPEKKSEE